MDLIAFLALSFAFLLVLANGFFVAAEFAMVKVRATRLEELSEKGNRRARVARHMVRHLDDYLGATQLGITLASLGLGWVGEPAFARLLEGPLRSIGLGGYEHTVAVGVAFTFISFLHIILGELVPKSIAIQRAESTTLAVSYLMRLFHFIFYPFLWLLNKLSNLVLRLFGLRVGGEHESALGPEELKLVVATSHQLGLLPERLKTILERTFALGQRTAREIMVPRADVVFLSTDLSFEENLARAEESEFSRYPLCENGDPDRIVGVVYTRDALFAARQKKRDIRALAKPILFVPSLQTADNLLQTFRRRKIHIAIVVDEYGGTLGVVTLEDVLEVLVGEIEDEYDTETPLWQKIHDGGFSVDAGVPAAEAAERLGFPLPEESPATLGGLLISALGRVPEEGDQVTLGNRVFEVTEMKKLRITRVRVSPPLLDDKEKEES